MEQKKQQTAFFKILTSVCSGSKLERFLCWTIALYVFLLPWQARWIFAQYSNAFPYYGGLSLYITDLLFLLITAVWLYWFFSAKCYSFLRSLQKPQKIFLLFIFFFLAFAGISLLWAPSVQIGAFTYLRVLQAGLLLFVLVVFPIRRRLLFLALLAAGLVQSLAAVSQFFLQEISASTLLGIAAQDPREAGVSVIEYLDQRWLRAYGTLPHPNIAGAFLALTAIIACGWFYDVYLQMRSQLKRWEEVTIEEIKPIRLQVIASLSSFLFLLIGLLLTFSRTAWFGFAVGWTVLSFFLFQSAKSKEEKKLLLVSAGKQIITGVLVLSALSLIFGPLWTMRVRDQSRTGNISLQERSALLEQARAIIKEDAVLGHGIGSYLVKVRELDPGQPVYVYQPVHNLWMLLWAELGLIGFFPFIGFIALILYFFSVLTKKRSINVSKAIALSGLLALAFMGYFEHFWWSLSFGLLLASLWVGMSFPFPFSWSKTSGHKREH